jgi:hypothetical protein
MGRTVLIMIALAAFAAACAGGTEVSANAHRRTPVTANAHAAHHPTSTRSLHHPAAAHASNSSHNQRTSAQATRKRTAQQVGEAAGLAILEGNGQSHSHGASRRRRSRPVLRSATVRRSRRRVRAYPERHLEEAAYVAPRRTYAVARTARVETAASVTATGEMPQHEIVGAVERGAAPAEAPEASEGAIPPAAAANSVPRREADQPEPDDAEMPENAASHESNADLTDDAAEDATAASAGTETEQASLMLPRAGMPLPLRGSLESLERQNERLEAEGLERIENESDLAARIADGLLVPVPASDALTVNADLPQNHRYCRPWTARFLAQLAQAHEAEFHRPFEVSSAVRTVEYQRRLMRTNGNAAPAEGDIVSPHLTGATVDIAKKGMSRSEIAWMRERLLALEDASKIDVEEEFHQACFHITVYKSYAPSRTVRPPAKATSPANPPSPQPEPSDTGAEAAVGGSL